MKKKIGFLVCLPLLLLMLAIAAPGYGGGEVTLYWEYNGTPLPDEIAGWRIYYGTASGGYSQKIYVADASMSAYYTVTGLADSTYYFAVTARYVKGGESDYSNEVSKMVGKPGRPNIYQIALNDNELLKVRYYLVFKGGEKCGNF